ncbi:hypothetical protein BRAS3843_40002 [Bradyrhizobium sp. STM 3843]|uniref:hypothetical protein n=1 Tax=Bradyrhizobium sp. STM 3843 TaxID=551947 RepID=UPI000240344B|nr:hypothetical protein [Bradyrhizobium sp. STM 3843]CCE10144.1 hypothetical protein BRAS3843_40002 [Bradyrhizobium sp. STM 3843]
MPENNTVIEILQLADRLLESQMAYINDNSPENASALREATHAYGKARSAIVIRGREVLPAYVFKPFNEVQQRVIARLSGHDLYRPLSQQEVGLALSAIQYTFEDVTGTKVR